MRLHKKPYCQCVKVCGRVLYPLSLLKELETQALQNDKKPSAEMPEEKQADVS
jgi:hypothetical protein